MSASASLASEMTSARGNLLASMTCAPIAPRIRRSGSRLRNVPPATTTRGTVTLMPPPLLEFPRGAAYLTAYQFAPPPRRRPLHIVPQPGRVTGIRSGHPLQSAQVRDQEGIRSLHHQTRSSVRDLLEISRRQKICRHMLHPRHSRGPRSSLLGGRFGCLLVPLRLRRKDHTVGSLRAQRTPRRAVRRSRHETDA